MNKNNKLEGSDSGPPTPRRGSLVTKAPRSSTLDRWGILNPWGDVWTVDTFNDADSAREYLRAFWSGQKQDLTTFRIVPVRVRVSVPFELRGKSSPDRSAAPTEPPETAGPDGEEG